jgi:cell division protein FtsB
MSDAFESSPPLRRRLQEKLPEILIEAASVVLALLLAFGVNAWHERNQEAERARIARAAILAELRNNREELGENIQAMTHNQTILNEMAKDDSSAKGQRVHLEVPLALLSEAAWRTAQSSQALRETDYGWTLELSKCYELQGLFMQMQWLVLEQFADMNKAEINTKADIARQLEGRIGTMNRLSAGLEQAYVELLDTSKSGNDR